jgi:hypothetical protein
MGARYSGKPSENQGNAEFIEGLFSHRMALPAGGSAAPSGDVK